MPPLPPDLEQTKRLRAISIGPMAHQALTASIVRPFARFERCAYVEAEDGQIACIGDTTIGDGPLNTILAPGAVAVLMADREASASYKVDLADATRWQPQAKSDLNHATADSAALVALRSAAHAFELREGLSPLLDPLLAQRIPKTDSNPLLARAWPAVASLLDWLRRRGGDFAPVPAEALGLIGLGPGLTPSGDDVLGGCLVTLHQTGRDKRAEALAAGVLPIARGATSRISLAHLECAAAGYAGAPLHLALRALLTGATQDLPACLVALDRVGHSSGWDGLIGVVLGLIAAQEIDSARGSGGVGRFNDNTGRL